MNLAKFLFRGSLFLACGLVVFLSTFTDCKSSEPPWGKYPVSAPLAVTLHSGRIVKGVLDPRTTTDHLWLTIENNGMAISGLVTIDEVAKIELIDLKQIFVVSDLTQLSRSNRIPNLLETRAMPSEQLETRVSGKLAQSLEIFAHLDNWNSDSRPDGIRLYVYPRSSRGELVPEVGTLSIELQVYRGDLRKTTGRLQEEETWSHEISRSDYNASGATIQLPFRKIQPDHEHQLYSLGVLKVRFKIAGQGVLEAMIDDVPLRNRSMTEALRSRR